jgi:hypothetical protein
LKILQQRTRFLYVVQLKQPTHRCIVQSDHTTHRGTPLRLHSQEHLNHWPILRQDSEVFIRWRRQIRQIKAEGRGIVGGFVNDATACPMLSGLDQFFRLAPCKLSK